LDTQNKQRCNCTALQSCNQRHALPSWRVNATAVGTWGTAKLNTVDMAQSAWLPCPLAAALEGCYHAQQSWHCSFGCGVLKEHISLRVIWSSSQRACSVTCTAVHESREGEGATTSWASNVLGANVW